MGPLDINKATADQIRSLRGIGEARARRIMELKDAKGEITGDDLYSIDIPTHIVDRLLEEGEICFKTEGNGQRSDTEATADPMASLLSAVKNMTVSMSKFATRLGSIEDRLDEAEEDRRFREQTRAKATYHNPRTDDPLLMHSKWGAADSSSFAAKAPKSEQEIDIERLLTQTSSLAPGGRYDPSRGRGKGNEANLLDFSPPQGLAGRPSTGLHSPWEGRSTGLSPWVMGPRPAAETNPFGAPGDARPVGRLSRNRQSRDQGLPAPPQPASPKMAIFDGKSDTIEWAPFHMQFSRLARRYNWTEEDKLDRFIECLRGRALTYFSQLPEQIRECYEALVHVVESFWGIRVHSYVELNRIYHVGHQHLRRQENHVFIFFFRVRSSWQ